jgi:hypothetical protein
MRRLISSVALAAALAVASARPAAAGEIIVDFFAAPGTGFADPTPVEPVGGNPGLTLGQQRIFVFLQAAAIWTEALKPEQDIFVAAQFSNLAAGVLGSAGARFIWSNFPGAELPNTWYFDSLADNLTQGDLSPPTYDIQANFSQNFPFYLGFDNADPPGTADLLAVVLHEIGHGLNFANAVTEATGAIPTTDPAIAFGDIYSQYTLDVDTNKIWNAMTQAERAASAINVRKVSWSGLNVEKAKKKVLDKGAPALTVLQPASLGTLMVGTASFGPPLTSKGITAEVVAAIDAADAAGPSTFDACSTIETNLAGKIALVDRGTCAFTIKVTNAQAAGAVAVIVADNVVALPPPGLGGADTDPPSILIPSVRISQPDGAAIRAALPGRVGVKLFVDKSILAGTDRVQGKVMLAALNPVAPGSSISHWDVAAVPNLLMEPAINADLTSSVQPPEDLSLSLLTDLGWFTDRDGVLDGVDHCLGSNISPTVVLGTCDSGAVNDVTSSGCSVADFLAVCEPLLESSHVGYVACVGLTSILLKHKGVITGREAAAITRCAAHP